jgi:protease II
MLSKLTVQDLKYSIFPYITPNLLQNQSKNYTNPITITSKSSRNKKSRQRCNHNSNVTNKTSKQKTPNQLYNRQMQSKNSRIEAQNHVVIKTHDRNHTKTKWACIKSKEKHTQMPKPIDA